MGQLLSASPQTPMSTMSNLEAPIPDALTKPEHKPAPAPYPSRTPLHELQQAFLDMRLAMFIHYNIATYQDLEWGSDRGPVDIFNPTHLDTDQWAKAALSAGMKGGFLTTKHHDGFCIWNTNTGTPSLRDTPTKKDVVGEYAASFRKHGLKVGLYYSILDKRNDIRHFNVTPAKIQLVKDHLTELLTNYGEINMIIFDGWAAPWSRIPYTEFPFHEIYRHVKSLQPDCLVTDLNASDYPPSGLFYGDIKAFEQNAGQVLPSESHLPAFSCVTLTDGWFFKTRDYYAEPKSTYQVVHDWLLPQNARHCTLIVNAAPARDGRLAPNLVNRLAEIGRAWHHTGPAPVLKDYMAPVTTNNLAQGCAIRCSGHEDTGGPDLANNGEVNTTWYTPHGDKEGWLEVEFPRPTAFNRVLFSEPVRRFADYPVSRIGAYRFVALIQKPHSEGEKGTKDKDGVWLTLVDGARPARDTQDHWLDARIVATKIRFEFAVAHDTAHVNEIAVYDEPVREKGWDGEAQTGEAEWVKA